MKNLCFYYRYAKTLPNMILKFLVISISVLFLTSALFAQIKLDGQIAGLAKGETAELYDLEKDELVNSAKVENERFIMQLQKLPHKKYLLSFKHAAVGKILWIEGTNIHIKGRLQDLVPEELKDSKELLNSLYISGGITQREEDNFYKGIATELLLLDTLRHPFEHIYSLQPAFNDFESVPRRSDSVIKLITERKKEYIKTHPRSLFSAYILISFLRENALTGKEFDSIFRLFSPINKQSYYGKILNSILQDGYSPIRKGEHFIDIVQKDTNNIIRKLSSLKGKLVVLTFWSSTCPAGTSNNMTLLSLYNKFNNSGFEVFAVSIDGNAAKWKKAIKKEGLPWINVVDGNGFFSITAIKYGINYIPRNFLISRAGTIIDVNLETDSNEIENRIKDLLSK